MQLKNEQLINIIEKTLDHVDDRLVDHGRRVAYLMYRLLHPLGRYDERQLRDICITAMLHDVGAYKTEEIGKMTQYETVDVWEHSIYGYLFLKYFSPLKELASVVLYHHANCGEMDNLGNPGHKFLAQLVSLCDRADVFLMRNSSNAAFCRHMKSKRDVKYSGEVVDVFLASGINIDNVFDGIDADEGFDNALHRIPLTREQKDAYIKMIISAIDFRSRYTVIHTFACACVAQVLAEILGAGEDAMPKIMTGAMLHDIGKIAISVNILDYPGRLSDADMAIMRTHVEKTAEILKGNVDEEIFRIAVRHHEKLDGSGYPQGLRGGDISFCERIMTVADIFEALCGVRSYKEAYPKDKVARILSDMSAQNQLDPDIAAAAIGHFDKIKEALQSVSQPVMQAYNDINEQYERLRKTLGNSPPRA